MTAEEVVGLLDSDSEDQGDDDFLEEADFDDIIYLGSDDDLGFEEEVIGNSSDLESEEEEQESDSESEPDR